MHKLFLDANILFTATHSDTGASYALFELAKRNKIELVSSIYAVKEAKRNIEKKIGTEKLPVFFNLVASLKALDGAKSVNPHSEYKELIVKKDLPILESAKKQKADFLITLDRKDFFTKKLLESKLPFKILLPGTYLKGFLG